MCVCSSEPCTIAGRREGLGCRQCHGGVSSCKYHLIRLELQLVVGSCQDKDVGHGARLLASLAQPRDASPNTLRATVLVCGVCVLVTSCLRFHLTLCTRYRFDASELSSWPVCDSTVMVASADTTTKPLPDAAARVTAGDLSCTRRVSLVSTGCRHGLVVGQ